MSRTSYADEIEIVDGMHGIYSARVGFARFSTGNCQICGLRLREIAGFTGFVYGKLRDFRASLTGNCGLCEKLLQDCWICVITL